MLSAIKSSGGLEKDVPPSNVSPPGLYETGVFFYSENRPACLVSEGHLFCLVNPLDKTCLEMFLHVFTLSVHICSFMFAVPELTGTKGGQRCHILRLLSNRVPAFSELPCLI